MKTTFSKNFLALALIAVFSFSCEKDKKEPEDKEPPATGDIGKMDVSFNHMVEDQSLEFGKEYINAKGDTFTVNRLIYYITNIVLIKSDGSKYTEANSYHLIDHASPATLKFALNNIPVGTYEKISFMIGVDSTRNVSGAQSGDLDPSKGMFWSWNTGYIFFKMEGKAPKSPGNKSYTYHIGGFEGEFKAQRTITLNLKSNQKEISKTAPVLLELKTNVNEVFKNPNLIDISTTYYQMSANAGAKVFADNYATMISVK